MGEGDMLWGEVGGDGRGGGPWRSGKEDDQDATLYLYEIVKKINKRYSITKGNRPFSDTEIRL